MVYGEAESVTATPIEDAAIMPVNIHAPSWRYMGERAAADGAYCVRFSVAEAPEPYAVPGGAWAYALPTTRAS